MAFKLGNVIIDRVQYGIAETFDGELVYVLSQLSECTIDITAESVDALDAQGSLIKRFWRGKTGEFTSNNAMLSLDLLGEASGEGKLVASNDAPIIMPRGFAVKAGGSVTLEGAVEGTVKVYAFYPNDVLGKGYAMVAGTTADADNFAFDNESKLLTLPVLPTEDDEGYDPDITRFFVKYDREVKAGVKITNRADKFPRTIKLTLKALAVDACSPDTLRACYIEFPSFQVSPEVSLTLSTDSEFTYSGSLQVNYCSEDKELYSIYFPEDEIEDAE